MAQDAKVIVLRGDRVTVETIVSFVAGHAEGIGAANPVRRLAPPWPAAQETNQVRALAAAAAPRSLVPLADDGTGWAYVAVGDEPDEFVAEWTGTDDVSFSTAISRDAAQRAEPVLPAGTLARCASAPALRRVLPPYCLVDEHDPRALQPGEAAADSLHSAVAWYCTFDNDTLQRIASKFEPRTTAVEIWAANAHRTELLGLAKPNQHRKQKGGFTRSELFNARTLLLIPLNGPPPDRRHVGGACKACASGPQRHKLKQHTCAGYYARVDTDDAATNARSSTFSPARAASVWDLYGKGYRHRPARCGLATTCASSVWNAIEQMQLRGRRRGDGVGRPKFDFHIGASGTIIPSRSTKLQKYAINCSGSGRGPKFPRPRSTRPSARCTKST